MYLDKKPTNGILSGVIINNNGVSYDIYYISNPTLIQKIYYRNFKTHFYIGVVSSSSYNVSLFFPYTLNNVEFPLPLKQKSYIISNLFTYRKSNETIYPKLLHTKSYIRKYRKTYPEL
jgi:hypothetical protein